MSDQQQTTQPRYAIGLRVSLMRHASFGRVFRDYGHIVSCFYDEQIHEYGYLVDFGDGDTMNVPESGLDWA